MTDETTTPVDLLTATQGALFRALSAAIAAPDWPVYDTIPAGAQPPFTKIGPIDSSNQGAKSGQAELLTAEIQTIYRGSDRSKLTARMHAARAALDGHTLAADGVIFQEMRWLDASASDASPQDGLTYAGISNFEVYAEPA